MRNRYTGKIVLLVEDEQIIALDETMQLDAFGYRVISVPSGEEAVALVRGGTDVDLVLMDIDLGSGIDGTEAAQRILALRTVPIVFLTSHAERSIVEKVRDITRYGYVLKTSGSFVLESAIAMAFDLFEANSRASESEKNYRSLFEYSPVALWEEDYSEVKRRIDLLKCGGDTCTRDYFLNHPRQVRELMECVRVIDVNRSAVELYRARDRSDLLKGIGQVFKDQGLEDFIDALLAVADGKSRLCVERTQRTLKGDSLQVQLNWTVPEGHTETYDRVLVSMTDISSIRAAGEALRKSEALLSRAQELARLGSIEFEPETGMLTGSAEVRKMFGVDGETLGYSGLLALTLPEHRPVVELALNGPPSAGKVCDFDFRARKSDTCGILDIHAVLERDPLSGRIIGMVQDVTDRKRIERELVRQNERVAIAMKTGDLTWWEADLRTKSLTCEPYYFSSLGYASPVFATYFEFRDFIHPDEQARFYTLMQEYLEGKSPHFELRYRVRASDGTYRWNHNIGSITERDESGVPLRVTGFVRDITEEVRLFEEFSASEARWQFALEGSGDGVWDYDLEAETVYYSPNWKRILGYQDRELENTHEVWESRIHPEDREATLREIHLYLSGATDSYVREYRMLCRDGTWKWILARGNLIGKTPGGKAHRMIGTHTDITPQKRTEEAIRSLLREKETLLREMYHRVKNNLATVASLLSLQARSAPSADASRVLLDAHARVMSILWIYQRLQISKDFRYVDLGTLLREISLGVADIFKAGNVRIELDIQLHDVTVSTETSVQIGIIVNELVTNAFKYAFPDNCGGWIRVEAARLPDGRVELLVADSGAGLPPDIDLEKPAGFGHMLVTAEAAQLGAELLLDRGKRSAFTLRFAPR